MSDSFSSKSPRELAQTLRQVASIFAHKIGDRDHAAALNEAAIRLDVPEGLGAKCCRDCVFFARGLMKTAGQIEHLDVCRRAAPRGPVVTIKTEEAVVHYGSFPPVEAGDWCGEWVQKK